MAYIGENQEVTHALKILLKTPEKELLCFSVLSQTTQNLAHIGENQVVIYVLKTLLKTPEKRTVFLLCMKSNYAKPGLQQERESGSCTCTAKMLTTPEKELFCFSI